MAKKIRKPVEKKVKKQEESSDESTTESETSEETTKKRVTKKTDSQDKKTKTESQNKKPKDTVNLQVRKFLVESNRPFAVNDVILQFRNEIGKAQMTRLLTTLVEEGAIKMKMNGKSAVYCAVQNEVENGNEELNKISEEVAVLEEEKKKIKSNVDLLNTKLNKINLYPADDVLKKEIEEMEEILSKKKIKLSSIGSIRIEKKDMEEAKKLHKKMQSIVKQRSLWLNEALGGISEAVGKKKSVLIEEMGIED